jgi:hypothetical protein
MLESILNHTSKSEKERILRNLFNARSFETFMTECATFVAGQPARLVADLSRLRLEANKRFESVSRLVAHAKRTTSTVMRSYLEAVEKLKDSFRDTPTLTRWNILEIHAKHCTTLLNEMQSGSDFIEETALVALESLQEDLAKDAEALVKQIGKTKKDKDDKVSKEDVHEHQKFIKALEREFKIEVHHFEPVNEGVFVFFDEENNAEISDQLTTLEDRLSRITDEHGYVLLRKGTIDDIQWGSYPNGLAKWMFVKVDLSGTPADEELDDLDGDEKKGKKLKPVDANKDFQTEGCDLEDSLFRAAVEMESDGHMAAHMAALRANGDHDTLTALGEPTDDEATTDEPEAEEEGWGEPLENPSCPTCGGIGMHLGQLGTRIYFRCRDCGMDFSHKEPSDEGDGEPESRSEPTESAMHTAKTSKPTKPSRVGKASKVKKPHDFNKVKKHGSPRANANRSQAAITLRGQGLL